MGNRLVLALCCLLTCATVVRAQAPPVFPQARQAMPLRADVSPQPRPATSLPADDRAVCCPNPCTDCCSCGHSEWFWISGEYLLWATRGAPLPPLISAAPASSTSAVPGALGNPDTLTVFGNERVSGGLRSGFRVRAGFWFDDWGLDTSFFYLAPGRRRFSAASDGTTTSLFRPIFNTITGQPGVEDLSNLADGIIGQVDVRTKSLFLGGDLNLRCPLCCRDHCGHCFRLDLLAGYRALGLSEDVQIRENLTTLDLAGNPNGTIALQDRFRTSNVFHGAQLGVDAEWQFRNWFVGGRALLAIGVTHQTVDISGITATQVPGDATIVQPGGLLALSTNSGHFQRDRFSVSPSIGLRVGYQWTPWLRTSAGYDFTYWSSVVRPGNQIDLTVNPNALPPPIGPPFSPPRPAFEFHGSEFWVQGLTLAIELQF